MPKPANKPAQIAETPRTTWRELANYRAQSQVPRSWRRVVPAFYGESVALFS